ncbi:MAG: hypothetical protein IPM61_00660 [Chlorobi bacterium]|nr:MAG: hypothetical protein UZ07_CHB004002472 [Chlorobi bacterium OLB7]MBK8909818.1 hypothetical protein [Chlorobiota bacterium]MBX7215573.1 hypothetical protein [Candidatus Kapabacteria bacterium]
MLNLRSTALLLLLSAVPAFSQPQTLFSGDIEQGVFAAPTGKFTQIAGDWGMMIGGRGEWLADHQFGIGVGGYALVPAQIYSSFLIEGKALTLRMTYLGLFLEYFFRPNDVLHVTVETMLGGGGLYYTITEGDQDKTPRPDNFGSEVYSVVEPGVNLELNLAPYLRFVVGASYRLAFNIDYQDLEEKDVNGLSANMGFRLGLF